MAKVNHFIIELSSNISDAINEELETINKSADDIIAIVNATNIGPYHVYVFYKNE